MRAKRTYEKHLESQKHVVRAARAEARDVEGVAAMQIDMHEAPPTPPHALLQGLAFGEDAAAQGGALFAAPAYAWPPLPTMELEEHMDVDVDGVAPFPSRAFMQCYVMFNLPGIHDGAMDTILDIFACYADAPTLQQVKDRENAAALILRGSDNALCLFAFQIKDFKLPNYHLFEPVQRVVPDTSQPVSNIPLAGLGAMVLGTPGLRHSVQLFEQRGTPSVGETTQVWKFVLVSSNFFLRIFVQSSDCAFPPPRAQSRYFAELSARHQVLEQTDAVVPGVEGVFFVGQLLREPDTMQILQIEHFYHRCTCAAPPGRPCTCPRGEAPILCSARAVHGVTFALGELVEDLRLLDLEVLDRAEVAALVAEAQTAGVNLTEAMRFPQRARFKLALLFWTGAGFFLAGVSVFIIINPLPSLPSFFIFKMTPCPSEQRSTSHKQSA